VSLPQGLQAQRATQPSFNYSFGEQKTQVKMHFLITNCEKFKIAIAAWNVFFSKMLKKK
jgi:hypothetical protein